MTGIRSVSVVVPTYNRANRLARLVDAIASQHLDAPVELIVVDDRSTDDTWAELERLERDPRIALRRIRLDRNAGPATARNHGWRAASAPLVVFTDDDCVPQPGWLSRLTAALARVDFAQGSTVPDPAQDANRGPFSHIIGIVEETGHYETCNIGYRREVLERLGGFDERFRHPYGEDTDLAWRAKELGASSAFVPEAVVLHDISADGFAAWLRGMRRHEGLVRALARHPQLRRALGLGIFYRPTHLPSIATVAAMWSALRRPRPRSLLAVLVACGWYARECRRQTPTPGRRVHWIAVVPARLAGDLYEVAVLGVASVRYRTLLV